MTDVIQRAPTARARCRGCGRAIGKGELKFGESFANPYAEGEAFTWFHLPCAALMSPGKLLPLLDATPGIADRDELRRIAEAGVAHARLPRLAGVERDPSGRAHCRSCRELIAKGALRLRVQIVENGRVEPLGYIHASCAQPYFGTADVLHRIERLAPDLSAADRGELSVLLEKPPLAPLAKAEPELDSAATARKSG